MNIIKYLIEEDLLDDRFSRNSPERVMLNQLTM